MKSFVLLTKDVLMPGYLSVYGNTYWKMPNVEELASKGTVFYRHYTTAPSTAMAFTSMFSAKYPYELDRRTYVHVDDMKGSETFFDKLEKMGYSNHIIWSNNYLKVALPFSNCFGSDKTVFHNLDINQPVGPHIGGNKAKLERNDTLVKKSMDSIYSAIDEATSTEIPTFLWIHLPHVILGRIGYGDDMDLVDELVGYLRKKFGDDSIFISADHGNMNGSKNKCGYGFDVYESAVRIPLITPRFNGVERVDHPTTNRDIGKILLDRIIPDEKFVVCDSTYFAQPRRKFAVIGDRFKYIYNKQTKTEELYDVIIDSHEEVNLIDGSFFDPDRRVTYEKSEVYFYPYWEESRKALDEYRAFRESIWRVGTFKEEHLNGLRQKLAKPITIIKTLKKMRKNKRK